MKSMNPTFNVTQSIVGTTWLIDILCALGNNTHTAQLTLTPTESFYGDVKMVINGETCIDTSLSFNWIAKDVSADIDGQYCTLDFGDFAFVLTANDEGIEVDLFDDEGDLMEPVKQQSNFLGQLLELLS